MYMALRHPLCFENKCVNKQSLEEVKTAFLICWF